MVIKATVPLIEVPEWALLERHLLRLNDEAFRRFEREFCAPDGGLRYTGEIIGRDGADDFYEPFFNWPIHYILGGSRDILDAAKHHWEGVTQQLTALGLVKDEYERGYDWFHQGESLNFFYALCAADPADERFRKRALKFAALYLPSSSSGIVDGERALIRAPHTGSDGVRPGLGDDFAAFSAESMAHLQRYGLPLRDVDGVADWESLNDPALSAAFSREMTWRMGRGDVAVNLLSTSLLANAWLFDHSVEIEQWIRSYVAAWRARAAGNGGLIPDNVGLSGEVGEYHAGAWYGGHYGWTWPHGLHSVEAAALIATINADLVTGEADLSLARVPLDEVMEQAEDGIFDPAAATLVSGWKAKLGEDIDHPVRLYPYRVDSRGWFDGHPMQFAFPTWLWWWSGETADLDRLQRLRHVAGYDTDRVRQFRDKEEAGHEPAWLAYLFGDNDDYPAQALRMAVGQAVHRLALIEASTNLDQANDIHWWQALNPVVTEVLTQLIAGAPAALYNGGLPLMRLRYWDRDAARPGLPGDVAALVRRVEHARVDVALVNLSAVSERRLLISAGAYAEDRITAVTYTRADDPGWPGLPHSAGTATNVATTSVRVPISGSSLLIELPPLTSIELQLEIVRRSERPRHHTISDLEE